MDNATMMTRALAFVLSESSGRRSRANVTVASGEGVLEAGTVLGKVTASSKMVVSPNAEVVGKEGAETATCILAYGIDATDTDVEVAVIDRDAEVKVAMLTYHDSVDNDTKKDAKVAQLDAVGIRVR